jgi:hypothetical protein
MSAPNSVYMGYDPREKIAYDVAEFSLRRRTATPYAIVPLKAGDLARSGHLWRTIAVQNGQMWDVISEAPMSTEFAISRFLTPILHRHAYGKEGWALFVDCDVLFLTDLDRLFELCDDRYAVMCVQHEYTPKPGVKMDKQQNQLYSRKNWSSVMLFNCAHPSNDRLTTEMVNAVPGRDLHRFFWLDDAEIGALPKEWNALIGEEGYDIDTAKIAHYTRGGPWLGNKIDDKADKVWLDERWAYVNSP